MWGPGGCLGSEGGSWIAFPSCDMDTDSLLPLVRLYSVFEHDIANVSLCTCSISFIGLAASASVTRQIDVYPAHKLD